MQNSYMRITLRQLLVFRTVCEQLSYSRAAELLALTQPAVSLQIRQLEELLEEPLFDYVGKKLYLTEAAEYLLKTAHDVFQRLDVLDMQLSELRGTLKGELRIAAESSAKYLLPHLLAAFQQRHPDIHPILNVFNRAQLIRRLNENRDDLVIMTEVPDEMALEFMPFLNNPIVAIVPAGHPLATLPAPLPLKALQQYTLVRRENGSGTRRACEAFFTQKHIHFDNVVEFNSHEAQREGVSAGLGIAFLPRYCVYRELRDGSLLELPIKELPIVRSWCLVHPRSRQLSPVAQAFENFILQERQLISTIAAKFESVRTPA
ncbi:MULTISPECIES: LysR substrate-binding domain-containing protein [Shewanella]|uniref:DNA-binding transcriptional LysR family regulator n=1 Tax=Shewanella fodinae TaxID=552357 RepID=A0A4R2F7C2_9GAMM|nr:LysR substrate-binding domain-containing protein [Shewanella fodinae]TCN82807.1 DNA-binding transcriptional LysR family regulator [Shewanella fodinae]